MLRNDGIGGTPRLFRYGLFCSADPTPGRPPLPRRTPCGVVHPCDPFKRAITILERWDPRSAQRVRAVLRLSGLLDFGRALDDA